MKSHKAYFLAGVILISPALASFADDEKEPYIEVRGTATEQAPVDRVIWSLRIRQVSPALSDAAAAIAESYSRLKADLEKQDVKGGQVRVAEVASGREFEMTEKTRKFVGFFAQRNVTVTLTDLEKLPAIQEALLKDDRISIESVFRDSSQRLEIKKRALKSAAEAARAKAQELADSLRVAVGSPIRIDEAGSSAGTGTSYISNVINQPIFSSTPELTDLDKVSFTSSITVRFEIRAK